jgi:hypothetical protein
MGLLKVNQKLFVVVVVLAGLSSCGVETSGVAPDSIKSLTSAMSCLSSTTVNLDRGQQVGVAGTARGVWSDVKFIPSGVVTGSGTATGKVIQYSTSVGAAYVDTGAQALKFAFWSGGVFKTEVVAGDSVANITSVRLGFLSNAPNTGLPIIFYSNGAVNNGQIMIAIRSSANLSDPSATWAVQSVDSSGGTTNRSLELSISPIDQVALVYQAATAPTANNIRFVFCSSGCQLTSSYVAQGSTATSRIDAGAVAAQAHVGVRWCQMSSGIYNPAVVYGASALTYQFAICNTGGSGNNLAACTTNAGWTKTTATMAATGASGVVSELYIDPSIIGDVPKMIVKDVGGAQMKTFSTSVGCNAVVAGTTYTAAGASALVGSGVANYGNSSLKILKAADYATPANERFFIVANDGTTAIKWSESSTNSFLGAWFANAATAIQTATLNAAGATNLGADLNLTTKQIVSSYGIASGSFNIMLGVVNDYTDAAGPASATQSYYQLPIEAGGHIQLNAAQVSNVAVAATSTNRPAVAWIDYSSGLSTTGKLKYALRVGASASNQWVTSQVAGLFATPSPQNPSLVFDQNDRPWIGYWDAQAGGAGRFVLATNTVPDGSGAWTSYQFPVAGAGHGAPAAQPAANMISLVMNTVGGITRPTAIVIDNGTTPAVKSASLNPATGAWSAVATIESLSAQGGSFLSADSVSTSGKVMVAYQNLSTGSVRVKYSASTDGGLTWPVNASAPYPVSNVAQGEGAVLKINPVTALPSISYYDRANAKLVVASCTANCTGTAAPTFAGTSGWVLSGIGTSGLSGAGNVNLLNAALTFSGIGDTYVAYDSGAMDSGSIKMIDSSAGALASSVPTLLVSGVNGALSNASATNGGVPWAPKSVRMANGVLATAYIAPGNYLNITTCGD